MKHSFEYALYGLIIIAICSRLTDARVVAAKEDICDRHPEFFICRNNQPQPQQPGPPPQTFTPLPPQIGNTPEAPLPPTPPPPQDRQPLDKATYCNTYVSHYTYFCGTSTSVSQSAAAFCRAYPVTCQITGPPPPTGATDPQILQLCREKAALAQQFCTGPGTELPQAKQQCDLWRQYCAGNPNVVPSTFNNPQVAAICSQYSYMADQYCPGYEFIQLRQYCNYYRVYCQGKQPFPNIDGNVGVVPTNWGVSGIPYYPFNPQGAVAGGQRYDIGFGDWGADVNRRTGVTDFYEQNDQIDANWQRGNFGGGTSVNVPIVGVGVYNRAGVSLGGIANPSDLSSLFTGGVPPGPPLSGLGQIPLSQGIPLQQVSPALAQANSLQSPVGPGGLGILGALARGAPLGAGPIGPLANIPGASFPGAPLGTLGSSGIGPGTGSALGLGK